MSMTSSMLKALSHPVRRQIMALMSADKPARATDLARLLDLPVNSVSFHLRQLAAAELIVEDREQSRDRRDRVWVAAGSAFTVPPPCTQGANDEAVLRAYVDEERVDLVGLLDQILSWIPEWSAGRDPIQRASLTTATLELSRQEITQVVLELEQVIERAKQTSRTSTTEGRQLWRVVTLAAEHLPRT